MKCVTDPGFQSELLVALSLPVQGIVTVRWAESVRNRVVLTGSVRLKARGRGVGVGVGGWVGGCGGGGGGGVGGWGGGAGGGEQAGRGI